MRKEITRVWKDIAGLEGRYQVSSDGFVRSLPDIDGRGRFMPGIILSATATDGGYSRVLMLGKDHKVHRLVAQAFLDNPNNHPQVNHLNGVRTDNQVGNLEWCSNSENQIHKYLVLGAKPAMLGRRGARCANSKRVIATNVTTGIQTGYESASEAARILGFSQSGISMAARGDLRSYKGFQWQYVSTEVFDARTA